MDQNISMIRFLMFMILALIIFFNLAPQIVDDGGNEDSDDNETNVDKDNSKDSESVGKYCLVDGTTHADKACKEISPSDSCQNKFASLEECKEWKGALEYKTDGSLNDTDGSLNYVYTTDDIDKKTIMTSDDMIFCLKNDKECKKMEFGDCHDIHIGTYLNQDNCEEAKKNLSDSEGSTYVEKTYCLDNTGNECIVMTDDNSNNCVTDNNGVKIEYCNMNQCKSNNSGATGVIDGEYCFNGSSCDQMSCSDTSCDGKYYTSLSTCKTNNGLS